MELAQLLLTPATLLSAFIVFWYHAKIGRDEIKREFNTDIGTLKEELKAEIMTVRREVAAVRDELKTEIREEIAPLRTEITAIRSEMHDMNGRLGRVEGLLRIQDAG